MLVRPFFVAFVLFGGLGCAADTEVGHHLEGDTFESMCSPYAVAAAYSLDPNDVVGDCVARPPKTLPTNCVEMPVSGTEVSLTGAVSNAQYGELSFSTTTGTSASGHYLEVFRVDPPTESLMGTEGELEISVDISSLGDALVSANVWVERDLRCVDPYMDHDRIEIAPGATTRWPVVFGEVMNAVLWTNVPFESTGDVVVSLAGVEAVYDSSGTRLTGARVLSQAGTLRLAE